MENNKNVISIRIKELRTHLNLTQEELAMKLGLKGKSSIANYESGNITPSDEVKIAMCKVFDCSMDYLMGVSNLRAPISEYSSYVKQSILDFLFSEYKQQFIENGLDDKALQSLYEYCYSSLIKQKMPKFSFEKVALFLKKFSISKSNIEKIAICYFEMLNRFSTLYIYSEKFIPFYADINVNYYDKEIEKELMESDVKISNHDLVNLEKIMQNINTLFFPNCKIIDKPQNTKNTNSDFYMCPVYGQISAGQPNWAEECIEGRLPIDPELMGIVNPEEHYFLRVKGESMNKVVKNGAFALIHKQDFVNNGEIAVVLVNGDNATLKHFSKEGDIVVLSPDSTENEFKQQIYTKETPIKVIGKYVGKMEFNK